MQLVEKYRPKSFGEVVGQDAALKQLLLLKNQGWEGQRILIVGGSGGGKTSIARLVAEQASCGWPYIEIDAQKLTVDVLSKIEEQCQGRVLGGGVHVFVVNEIHTMSSRIVSNLQTVLEIPCATRTSLWIMTTTDKGQKHLFDTRFDAIPFLSRFTYVETSSDEATMEAFARRAMFIAQAEHLDGQPLSAYRQLAKECDCNLRQMIQRIAGGSMLT